MSFSSNNMPSLLDREILARDQDAFGHRHYADALRSLAESTAHDPPYSVGLLGAWGTGKSTIKEIYLSGLREDTDERGHKFHPITFNAWRYSENVKRALLRQVYLALGGSETTLNEKLFGETRRTEMLRQSFGSVLRSTMSTWSVPLLVVLFLIVLVFLGTWGALTLLGITSEWVRGLASTILTGLAAHLINQVKLEAIASHLPVTKVELPTTTAEQYQDLLLEQLRAYKRGKVPIKNASKCERIIVFVDDLDRLSSEEMVQGLDAIRTFMEIPARDLPKELGIVFVISCDEDRIAHALEKGRHHMDLPGSVFNRSDARRYLDRIFQFRLEIPPFPRRDMREYSLSKLKELDLPNLKGKNEDINETMIHVGVQTPRNALQIVNAFAQSWWIAYRRETSEAGSVRPGALCEGAVTDHPLTLAALSALRVDFPDFYLDVQKQPDLVHRLMDVVFERRNINEFPLATRETLSKYLERHTVEKKETIGPEIAKDHRPLRQFLATLQTHRWPPSLQPLLLLSQDPVTRRYGDRAPQLYDALTSGDLDGVLESLGRNADAQPLNHDDVHLLKDMTEDLSRETQPRRVAAATVLASLVDRLPEGNARVLIGPLTRQLEASAEVRWRLGVQRIEDLIRVAEPTEKRAIAAALVEDILTTDKPMTFRLTSGETPSLEEATSMARNAVNCVLRVRNDHGLYEPADKRLRDWLLVRRVTADSAKSHELPFPDLHEWVRGNPGLLPLLGHHYTDLLISELEAESIKGLDVPSALECMAQVFAELLDRERNVLWSQLTRLLSVKNGDAVKLAWETLVPHPTAPDPMPFSGMILSMSQRLTKEMKETEAWTLDWETAAAAILGLVEARPTDLSSDAQSSFRDLIVAWGDLEETAAFSVRGLQSLPPALSTAVTNRWSSNLFDDRPDACRQYLATNFSALAEDQQTNVGVELEKVVTPTLVSEDLGKHYAQFLGGLPESAWEIATLQEHLESILGQIGARHNNPDGYLERVFPAVSKVLRFAPDAAVGKMLHALFTNAKSQPLHYAFLHSWMAGRWPVPSDELSPYAPATIFSEAHQFCVAQPQNATPGLLSSMKDMMDRAVVPDDKEPQLIAASCAVWTSKPKGAQKTLVSLEAPPSPQQTADLLDAVTWDNEELRTAIAEVWRHVASQQEPSDRSATTELILAKGPQGTPDNPDAALTCWIDGVADRGPALKEGFENEGVSDAGRKRLWLQAVRFQDELGLSFYRDSITHLLGLPDNEETVRAVLDSKAELASIVKTADARATLSEALLVEVFPKAPTKTAQAGAAEWAKDLDGHAGLRKLESLELTVEGVDILENLFGKSSTKQLRKSVEKND